MTDLETKLADAVAWFLAYHDNPMKYDRDKIEEFRQLLKTAKGA